MSYVTYLGVNYYTIPGTPANNINALTNQSFLSSTAQAFDKHRATLLSALGSLKTFKLSMRGQPASTFTVKNKRSSNKFK